MKVKAVYERGVFRLKEKADIPEHGELVIHFWPEINHWKLIKAIQELKAENDALKTIICSDHPEASIC